jgi:hypothetical protein
MLTSTFVLLKGIGPATERRLWQDGVADWSAFLGRSLITGISATRKGWYDEPVSKAGIIGVCFTRSVIARPISTLKLPASPAAKPSSRWWVCIGTDA